MGHVDHEQGEVRRIVHGGLLDIHKVLKAPILLGVSDIELHVAAQAVIIDKWRVTQIQIAATEHDMGAFLGREVRWHDEDDMQWLSTLCVQHLGLIPVSVDVVFDAALLQGATWEVDIVNLCAVLAPGSSAGRGPIVREREGSIMASLRNQLSAAASYHVPSRVVAAVAIQHHRTQRDEGTDHVQEFLHHALEPLQCRGQRHDCLVLVFAAFWPTRFPLLCFFLSLECLLRHFFFLCRSFFSLTPHHLFDHHWIGVSLLGTKK